MMLFCPPNITLNEVWVDGGTSQCFMDTVSNSVTAGWLLLFGTSQLWIYHKYGTALSTLTLPKSQLYGLQILLLALLPVLCCVRFAVQVILINDYAVYGYMIVSLALSLIQFPLAIALVVVERLYVLPSVPSRGHGLVLLLFWTLLFIFENLSFVNLRKNDWWFHLTTLTDKIEMALFVLRYVSCLGVFVLGLRAPGIVTSQDIYNSLGSSSDVPVVQEANASTWRNFWKKLRILAPYLWPRKEILLQFRVLFCFALLLGGRVINVYVPIFSKLIVDSMAATSPVLRYDLVILYVLFKFLQGSGTGAMGLLNNLRSFLWIRIQQYTTREVELSLFQHLHSLSLRWHLSRKTGAVLRIMDRGTDSINNLLNYILFSIFPTITDILVAVIFFVTSFNGWFGLLVFVTMALYIAATILVTEWRTKFQRRMNLADNAQNARSVDSLLNYETVKYYCTEDYELEQYEEAIVNYQEEEWKSNLTLNMLNTIQNFLISGGLLAGSLLCVHMVVDTKQLTVGDYVLFAAYIVQLYVPLNWFGTYYRAIQKNFVDMENMFDLLKEHQEVVDIPGAGPLEIRQGNIEFCNVTFSYVPERTILKNISFRVPGGKTVAIVGPSGSGKTTIMRLLFRFYDVDNGAILIDGQNVKTVQQTSLRQNIGVVPQDTVLFNNTIMYNIQYARLNAPEADVIAAAKSAEIHDRILTFPDGYDCQVGERGLKLSGGEKQRVAIARTILKSPAIVLLDEATSALDTQTERNIQAALHKVCTDRTTVIIAHRLSTIIHADEILVLKDGEIVERGRHDDLITQDGVYAGMWQQQLKSEAESKKNSSTVEEDSNDGANGT